MKTLDVQISKSQKSHIISAKSHTSLTSFSYLIDTSDGYWLRNFDQGWVIFLLLRSGQPPQGPGFQKFPLNNTKFFNFFPFGSKKSHQVDSKNIKDGSATYLLRVKSMLPGGSSQGPYLIDTHSM